MKIYDKDIRPILYDKISNLKEFTSDNTSIIIDEFPVVEGSARVDIAVVNGKLHGFEIKSEQDTLDRLSDQIFFYNMVFDKMTLVVSEKFKDKLINIIPKWWGIYYIKTVGNKPKLVVEKKSKLNKDIKIEAFLSLLWRNEMLELLLSNNIKKGVKSKNKEDLTQIIIKNFSFNEIKNFTRLKLKTRNIERAVLVSKLCDDL
ncbi:sce7726 family protein [Fusobacterium ulcerans]|uniref:sce7726 family protein n=1 Tax=Fusobacterium ulcerans TaxID=861 RepID=UPI001031BDD4|nr:sce7726 family protein [Fusobacterium ulcerans]